MIVGSESWDYMAHLRKEGHHGCTPGNGEAMDKVMLDARKRRCCLVSYSLVTGRLASMSQQMAHAMDGMFRAFKRQIDRSAAGGANHSA